MIKNESKMPDLHDWEIVGISTDRNNNLVELSIVMPENKEKSSIVLRNVKRFFMSEMLMQNVILDLLLFEKESDSNYFTHCCRLLNIDPSTFNSDKNTKIIYFEPSIGAEIACCFTDFNIYKQTL